MDLIQTLEREEITRLNKTIPPFAPGDTVIVSVNVVDGTRKRVQAFEGVVVHGRARQRAGGDRDGDFGAHRLGLLQQPG